MGAPRLAVGVDGVTIVNYKSNLTERTLYLRCRYTAALWFALHPSLQKEAFNGSPGTAEPRILPKKSL
jgi:hypothetical protein